MFRLIRNVALSALIALGALGTISAPALAQSGGVYLGFGSNDRGPGAGFRFSERGRYDYRDNHRGRHGRDRADRRGFCSPREAVRKASRMGLRNVRVVASNSRMVRVEGQRRHGQRYYHMSFANARDCPVLR